MDPLLTEPLTVGNLLLVNVITITPVLIFLARVIWFLGQTMHKVDQMWSWWQETQVRKEHE